MKNNIFFYHIYNILLNINQLILLFLLLSILKAHEFDM